MGPDNHVMGWKSPGLRIFRRTSPDISLPVPDAKKRSKNAALATTADGHWHERPEGAKAVFSRGPLVLLPFYPRGGAGAALADSRLPRKAESTLNETKRAQRIFFTGL